MNSKGADQKAKCVVKEIFDKRHDFCFLDIVNNQPPAVGEQATHNKRSKKRKSKIRNIYSQQ